MIENILLESGEYGRKAVLTSVWSPEMSRYLFDSKVVELELNDGKGWCGEDLSFLVELPWLRVLKIIDLKISSVVPIHSLHELIVLEVITYCKTEIIFSAFPKLEECALEWRDKATSLFECTTLRKLFINRYSGRDVSALTKLVNLRSLTILNAPVQNLIGLSDLKNLRYLRLANLKRLSSLAGIEGLANLDELEINTCNRISSIAEVGYLMQLRKLHLNNGGDIQSLKPLKQLKSLVSVLFYESTNIVDGDLTPLLLQTNLSQISSKNRRHYSHRQEYFR